MDVNSCVTSGELHDCSVPILSENEDNNSAYIVDGMVRIS